MMRRRGRLVALGVGLAVVIGAATVVAQRRGGFGGGGRYAEPILPNIPYDGRFTFIRLRYGPATAFASQRIPWSHDYPNGEQHFMKIMNELSYLNPHTDETNIIGIGDPELFNYPVAYLCEPGAWFMSDEEAANLREYLQKGGFLIIDDFRYQHWSNFEQQMTRVLPSARFYDLDASHPIFHAFFEIKSLDVPQYYDPPPAIFRAVFEDNDPHKRIMVMINYNTDISEYWEWSDTGFKPIDESNEAYKIGVNYIIYGMTH
jgi:hypothetical protein